MEKKKAGDPVSDINVTPMVDVMLVLLIIFMVITPMLTKSLDIDLYKGKMSRDIEDADKEDAVIVFVTRDGQVFMSPPRDKLNKVDNVGNLPSKVRDALEQATQDNKDTVYIKADQRAPYGKVEDVVDNLRAAGIEKIALLTDLIPRGTPGGAPALTPGG